MDSVHAILMTGNNKKGYINGIPKCYVELPDGTNPASRVLTALNSTRKIESVTVIGDKKYLDERLKICTIDKPLIRISQKYNASFSDNFEHSYEITREAFNLNENEGVLYIAGDTPFRRGYTIDFFVSNIDKNLDIAVPLIPEHILKAFFDVYRKPLLAVCKNRTLGWYKSDYMCYIKPKKIPKDIIEILYKKRNTNKLEWLLETLPIIKKEYPEIFGILLRGWLLKQYHRLTKDLSKSINSPNFFNQTLEISNIESVLRENDHNLNCRLIEIPFADGYLDIDNKADLKKLYKNFDSIISLINRVVCSGN